MKAQKRLFTLWRFMLFFMAICFVVTASFLLFGRSMRLDESEVRAAAPKVFGNIFLLSLFCCVCEYLVHRFTSARQTERIRAAARSIAEGDFNARVDTRGFTFLSGDLKEIAEDINYIAEELSLTQTVNTDFVANVSHEMKTPLSVIRNYAVMLKGGALDEGEVKSCAEGIDSTVQRLSGLITNILKLNRLEHGKSEGEKTRINLSDQLAEAALMFDEQMNDKQIELEADMDENVFVEADRELLGLVWSNLLSNAVKFTPEGGTITIEAHADGQDAVVTVSDTGIGMNEQTGRHIFDKFYQGDTSHATQGNGLGLAMVKKAVDITEGEISVRSVEGRGSSFTVRLKRSDNGEQ